MLAKRRSYMIALFVLSAAALSLAQVAPAPGGADADAAQAYSEQEWAKAEGLYAALTQSHPEDAHYWYRYAVSAQWDKHYEAALHGYTEAKRTGSGKGLPAFLVDYNVATVHAAMGHAEEAFSALKSATAAGFSQPDKLESDTEWSLLRGDPRFVASLEQIKKNLEPCKYSAESRQFDFWIGDWDVVSTAGGAAVGSSHIAQALGDCVIWENWTSAGSPYAGKSYNVYDVNLKRWEQFWVDNSAGMMFFYGGLKDGVMDFWTDVIPQPDGTTLKRHLQFFNLSPDAVRQFSQKSLDGGKTWMLDYDFTYHRRKT